MGKNGVRLQARRPIKGQGRERKPEAGQWREIGRRAVTFLENQQVLVCSHLGGCPQGQAGCFASRAFVLQKREPWELTLLSVCRSSWFSLPSGIDRS